jgi:oligopeptide transport system substrate-binding protein
LTGSGCKKDTDGSGHIFSFDLAANPRTLDPQTAVMEHEHMVIMNLFTGLMRMDADEAIVPAAAREHEISDDGLTYIFRLRDDIYWRDAAGFSAKCTAHDFEFAFRRLFNPQVKSRNAADYYSILNSQRIHNGHLPLEHLGVIALDDFTLEIVLNEPDERFLTLLTLPPAFPCNEAFFISTQGRYGLIGAAVAANGGFFLREWVYDPHWIYENRIILRRHEKNSESERVYPRGIDFLMDRGDKLENFTSGGRDGIVLSGQAVDSLIKSGYPRVGSENLVMGLAFNTARTGWESANLRRGLALSIDLNHVDFNPTGYRKAVTVYDAEQALRLFNSAADLLELAPVVIVPFTSYDDTMATYVRTVAQQWQEKLSLFCRIDELTLSEFARRLGNGDYDIAVVSVPLSEFFGGSDEFIPLCYVTQELFMGKNVRDLLYNPLTGAVIFREGKGF